MNNYVLMQSEVVELVIVANDEAITAIYPHSHAHFHQAQADNSHSSTDILQEASAQLMQYFAHERREFELPLAPYGTQHGTRFQQHVWQELQAIPYGATSNYGVIAKNIGNPQASRAVGTAIGRNPISIMIPCHRVIGANGALTGYAGGIAMKQWLLTHETSSNIINN